ncbi:O-antigen ligase family protein [Alkalibacter saccharofermentans]|uniref:O-antigen ligase like membrane protein n=1 Tax=Alkalibacter saccharofermentans DSM 14828 TaxID=1120975 RepID=A0A1M4ZH33_9FIRM|nr:hypothetical protein [Alkalibacter saccharofermentans]SHF17107.1 hypothetical protein SAMN02746064_02037 [Alkalibacter saccharofermentans DSM 14828]
MIKSDKGKIVYILILALLNVALLSVGHAVGSSLLLLLAIMWFAMLAVVAPREYYMPIMIFYLPWTALLKLSPGMSSVHSLVTLLVLLIVGAKWLKKNPDISGGYFAIVIIFAAYTLIIKFLNRLPLEPQYIFFMAMMLFIPIYLVEYKEKVRFDVSVLFLAFGNLAACISALLLIDNSNIQPFIVINNEMSVGIRFSAFYSDPNYFSAQMLVAISGLMIILTKTKNKKNIIPAVILIIALIYYAMQSVSKAFMLSAFVVLSLWLFNLMTGKRSISFKIYLVVAIMGVVFFVLSQDLFMQQLELYLLRFGRVEDASSLTTGRVGLWGVYLNYLMTNTDKLLFGIGLSEDQLRIILNTNNAHMTLIEMLYQIGLFGVILMGIWWKSLFKGFMDDRKLVYSDWMNMGILAIAIVMPWFGLDVLYFREFFYFPAILLLMKKYLVENA